MQHLEELNFLIDAASKIAGNDSRLATAIGTSRMKIWNWRRGIQPCPPEQQALMATVAGFDPTTTLIRAVVEKHEGTELGDRLMRALGKGLRATGAALGFVGASALAIYSLSPTPAHAKQAADARGNTMYRQRNSRYVKRRLARN